jgi:hypothetical protein
MTGLDSVSVEARMKKNNNHSRADPAAKRTTAMLERSSIKTQATQTVFKTAIVKETANA